MAKKQIRNRAVGPANLVRDEIDRFLNDCDDPDECLKDYKAAADSLAMLAIHPEVMVRANWFPAFYARHPKFTLAFMLSIRTAAMSKSPAEQYMHSMEYLGDTGTYGDMARKLEQRLGLSYIPDSQFTTAAKKIESKRKRRSS